MHPDALRLKQQLLLLEYAWASAWLTQMAPSAPTVRRACTKHAGMEDVCGEKCCLSAWASGRLIQMALPAPTVRRACAKHAGMEEVNREKRQTCRCPCPPPMPPQSAGPAQSVQG
eukprot:1119215-Pelagomonas_calceolata.AAC.7